MARVYYVNPTNTADIRAEDLNGLTLRDGAVVTLPIDGVDANPRVFQLAADAPPANFDCYPAIEDNTPVPQYYTYNPALLGLTFSGTAGVSGTVTEDRTPAFVQLPIADLYQRKRDEVFNEDIEVRYNAVDTSLSVNWWLIITREATTELLVVAAGSNSRQIDGAGWPGGSNAPWVGIYNANNNDTRRYQLTDQATWDTLETEWYQHLQATGNATDASRSALDATYDDGAGDWQAVADHDASDPAWGYPPTVDPGELQSATA